tara:strand:+ start:3167 stop:3721 length:555 start_codon:yes stop_codon:yes gene_type:complete
MGNNSKYHGSIGMAHLEAEDFRGLLMMPLDSCALAVRVMSVLNNGFREGEEDLENLERYNIEFKNNEDVASFLEVLCIVIACKTAYSGYVGLTEAGEIEGEAEELGHMAILESVRHLAMMNKEMDEDKINDGEYLKHLMASTPDDKKRIYSSIVAITLSLIDCVTDIDAIPTPTDDEPDEPVYH